MRTSKINRRVVEATIELLAANQDVTREQMINYIRNMYVPQSHKTPLELLKMHTRRAAQIAAEM